MKTKKSHLHEYYNKEYLYVTQNDRGHFLTRILLDGRLEFAEKAKGNVLDIGCNDGLIDLHIKNRVDKITGVDISKNLVDIAKSRKINAFVCDAENLSPLYRKSFDTVMILETLEHLENPSKCLKEIKKVLKKDGRLLLTVPSAYGFITQLLEVKSKLQNKNAPIHHMYKKNEIREVLEKNGFRIVSSSYISLFNSIAIEAEHAV